MLIQEKPLHCITYQSLKTVLEWILHVHIWNNRLLKKITVINVTIIIIRALFLDKSLGRTSDTCPRIRIGMAVAAAREVVCS